MENLLVTIQVSIYKGQYHAHRVDKTGCCIGGGPGVGRSPAEAIGDLVIRYPNTTNTRVIEKTDLW